MIYKLRGALFKMPKRILEKVITTSSIKQHLRLNTLTILRFGPSPISNSNSSIRAQMAS